MLANNVSLPSHLYGFIREGFCRNDPGAEGVVPCVVYGVEAVPNAALGFHVLREDGVLYSQVPLHALCWEAEAPRRRLCDLTPWDCFGPWLTAAEFDYLKGCEFEVKHGDLRWGGEYVCTIDFLANGYSAQPEQHKHFHLLRLSDGGLGCFPNNYLRVTSKSFTGGLFDWSSPPVEANRLDWSAERGD